MKSIASRVTPKHRKALALFYETETHEALKAVIKIMKANAASHSLLAPDWEVVKHLQGQAFSLKALEDLLKEIHGKEQKL